MTPAGTVFAGLWADLGVPALLVAIGAVSAAAWPWWQARQRRRRFESFVRRELENIGPWPETVVGRPWSEYLPKRFIHEEIFKTENISGNVDFLASLDGGVVYLINQMWNAYYKKDATAWLHFMRELCKSKVGSPALRSAADSWQEIIDAEGSGAGTTTPA
jgi:hypothetical protein